MTIELANAHTTHSRDERTPKAGSWALVGATGVTGRLILERALAHGHRPTLLGRDPARLAATAAAHDLATRRIDLGDARDLRAALEGHRLVLNAAGPFTTTGGPMIEAALAAGVDYLDLNGELAAFEALLAQDAAARARGVALVGGVGFGVAAADGLAALAAQRLGGADWVRLSVAADSGYATAAVAESTLAVLEAGGHEVRDGRLVRARLAARRWSQRTRDGARVAFASAPLAELAAVQHALPDATVVAGVPMPRAQALVVSTIAPLLPMLLKIPPVRAAMASTGGHAASDDGRVAHTSRVWVEARRGRASVRGALEAGEGFALAADFALAGVDAMLHRSIAPGAHTPASAFGADFVTRVPGVRVSFET